MQNKIISLSVLTAVLTGAYFLLFYIPQQRRITLYNQAHNSCLTKYEKAMSEKEHALQEGLKTCNYTGVCTREQFIEYAGTNPFTQEWKDGFISSCMKDYNY